MDERKPICYTLNVQNFQSLRNVTLEIEGLTVLYGSHSNIGKSSFVRALEGMLFGGCTKDNIRHGCTALSVSLDWEGHHISFRKGEGENDYEVDGVLFKKVGREVPQAVADLGFRTTVLKDLEVNLQIRKQFDKAFPLVLAPSDMGKVVGALVQTEKVYSASKELLSDSSRVRIRMGKTEALIGQKDREYQSLAFVDTLSVQVDAMDSLGVAQEIQKLEQVRRLFGELIRIGADTLSLTDLLQRTEVDGVSIEKFTHIMELLTTRKALSNEESALINAVGVELPDEGAIRNVATLVSLVREKRTLLSAAESMVSPLSFTLPGEDLINLLQDQLDLIQEARVANAAVAAVEKEMETAGVKVCPQCDGTGLVSA